MSSLALYAAPIDNNDNTSGMNDITRGMNDIDRKRQTRNKSKTLKKRPNNQGSHVRSMMNHIHQSADMEDENYSNMSNFQPPPAPIINDTNDKNDDVEDTDDVDDVEDTAEGPVTTDGPVTTEGFDKLQNTYANDYYNQHVPYYNKMSPTTGNKDELREKLNYMIHLLEEQQDDKTGHVTEEIILYSFLGVFMIFIVDSFARAGKYVR
jgi:hypothetical protein